MQVEQHEWQVEQHKCRHRPCRCIVPTDATWCSPQCEEEARQSGDAAVCECGHADCERTVAIEDAVPA